MMPVTNFLHGLSLADRRNASVQWRHNGSDGVSIHQPRHCLPIVCSDADERKHHSSASLAFVRGIHRWPVNSPHKWPVMRKMFPFDDVIMVNVCFALLMIVAIQVTFFRMSPWRQLSSRRMWSSVTRCDHFVHVKKTLVFAKFVLWVNLFWNEYRIVRQYGCKQNHVLTECTCIYQVTISSLLSLFSVIVMPYKYMINHGNSTRWLLVTCGPFYEHGFT